MLIRTALLDLMEICKYVYFFSSETPVTKPREGERKSRRILCRTPCHHKQAVHIPPSRAVAPRPAYLISPYKSRKRPRKRQGSSGRSDGMLSCRPRLCSREPSQAACWCWCCCWVDRSIDRFWGSLCWFVAPTASILPLTRLCCCCCCCCFQQRRGGGIESSLALAHAVLLLPPPPPPAAGWCC